MSYLKKSCLCRSGCYCVCDCNCDCFCPRPWPKTQNGGQLSFYFTFYSVISQPQPRFSIRRGGPRGRRRERYAKRRRRARKVWSKKTCRLGTRLGAAVLYLSINHGGGKIWATTREEENRVREKAEQKGKKRTSLIKLWGTRERASGICHCRLCCAAVKTPSERFFSAATA